MLEEHGLDDLLGRLWSCGVRSMLQWRILCGMASDETYRAILCDAVGLDGASRGPWARLSDALEAGRALNGEYSNWVHLFQRQPSSRRRAR